MHGALRLAGAARTRHASRMRPMYELLTSSFPSSCIEHARFITNQQPYARSPSFVMSCATSYSRGISSAKFRRTSSSMSKATEEIATVANRKSHLERLKDLWRKYGVVAIGTYLSMYGAVLGSIYLAIDQGWVRTSKRSNSDGDAQLDESFNLVTTTNRLVKLAEDLGIAQHLEVERVNSKTGTFLLAWIATKFTEPVRLALTLAVTPRIARFLGRAPKLPPKTPGRLANMITKQQQSKEQQQSKA